MQNNMTQTLINMSDVALSEQRVLIREDLNVPMQAGVITDETRIQCALPTLQLAIASGASVRILSHLGRPKEGQFDAAYSLRPVADRLSELLEQPVRLVDFNTDPSQVVPAGEVVLYENVRFLEGEKSNDPALAKRLAASCDVFVMDAFATAHRAHASTAGVAEFAPIACAGPLLLQELDALEKALHHPKHPVLAIVGGSKVSSKFHVLSALLDQVDVLLVGGGIANTFLKAAGYAIGQSLYEPDWVDAAADLLQRAERQGVSIPLPIDVCVAEEFSATAASRLCAVDAVAKQDRILDVGVETAKRYQDLLKGMQTVIWNGPVGVFEFPQFSHGTQALGEAIANSNAFSIAGGGDTLAALAKFHLSGRISYRSTGGGAFLELLEGKTLPVVAILEQRAQ
jgi:phosphoglycerate kinase